MVVFDEGHSLECTGALLAKPSGLLWCLQRGWRSFVMLCCDNCTRTQGSTIIRVGCAHMWPPHCELLIVAAESVVTRACVCDVHVCMCALRADCIQGVCV